MSLQERLDKVKRGVDGRSRTFAYRLVAAYHNLYHKAVDGDADAIAWRARVDVPASSEVGFWSARFSSLSMIWFRPFHGSPTSALGSAPAARQCETSAASAT